LPLGKAKPGIDEAEEYSLPIEEIRQWLKTDLEEGLSQKEAEERLKALGPNIIPKIKPSLIKTYIAPLQNWLIDIYLMISAILAFLAIFLLPSARSLWVNVVEWLSVIAINATLAILQQERAQIKLESLQRLSAPKAKVLREGRRMEIPSEDVVPGDIIRLEHGDRIPADARIIVAYDLKVNESALTGESEEVVKIDGEKVLEKGIPIFDRGNMLFLGTYVTSGSTSALVVRTGRSTQLGRISKVVGGMNTGEIILRRKINDIAKFLGLVVLAYIGISLTYYMIVLYLDGRLITGGIWNERLVAETLVRCLITAMSVMPINITLLTTIILITGVLAMAKQRVVIRDLNAVEGLGRVSVVCADKTGTITGNEMTVKWVRPFTPTLYGVTGAGFRPYGKIVALDADSSREEILRSDPEALNGIEAEIEPETPLEYILVSGMLNNDSTIIEEKVRTSDEKREEIVYRALGDATDASLMALFQKSKLDRGVYRHRYEGVRYYTFDAELRLMTRIFQDRSTGRYVAFTRGAMEALLPRCDLAWGQGLEMKPLDDQGKSIIDREISQFSAHGYRVISFAIKYLDILPERGMNERESVENDMTYLGFVAITDPPREGVRESVIEADNAGIRSVMITGDNKETARNIAQEVGIAKEGDLAVEGHEIELLPDDKFLRASIFARISPEDKMSIVDRYKGQRRVVAMTGDGVNDALALSKADVGIAMGITGTDVAKEASDMIITDDSYNSIITGIREGRGTFHKIRSIIFFYIAVNLAEALLYFGTSLILRFNLLNIWQQVYIFMTAHSLPPFAIILDSINKDVMKEGPRNSEGIFTKQLKIALLLFSISLALIFYGLYFGTLYGIIPVYEPNKMGYTPDFSPLGYLNPIDWAQAKARTMLNTVALITECTLVISLRRMNKSIIRMITEEGHWVIWPFILIVPLAHIILMYNPVIQCALFACIGIKLEIIRLTLIDWAIVIGSGLVPILLLESYKALLRKRALFI
jgi:Ca2+-transporting ATPase